MLERKRAATCVAALSVFPTTCCPQLALYTGTRELERARRYLVAGDTDRAFVVVQDTVIVRVHHLGALAHGGLEQ